MPTEFINLIGKDENPIDCSKNNNYFQNKLISKYEEIERLVNKNDKNLLNVFYFNKENVQDILYETDNVVKINDKQLEKISGLFYCDLLINNEPNVINYTFSIKPIIRLYSKIKSIKECPVKMITTKLLFDMIENFKGFCKYDQNITIKRLNKLSRKCKEEIKKLSEKNDSVFNNYDYIMEQKIDKLYIDVPLKLINSEKDSFSVDNINNILDSLGFEEIYLNKNMLTEFNAFIKKEKDNEKFFIKNIEDLINFKKINFYNIILKYLLKNPIYIYQYNFLLETRSFLIKLIKNDLYTLQVILADLKESDPKLEEKLEYIIEKLIDCKYYYEKYLKEKESLKDIISNIKLRHRYLLIKLILIDELNNNTNHDSLLEKWETIETSIKEKKYKKIHREILKKLIQYFNNEKNKYLLLKIFSKAEYESLKNLDINNIEFEEEKNEDKTENNLNFKHVNDIQPDENDNLMQSQHELSQKRDINTFMIEQTYTIDENITEVNTDSANNNIKIDFNKFKKSDKYKVIESYDVIETETKSEALFNFSKNLSKGHYITGLNSNKLSLYNSYFERKLEIFLFDTIINVYEIKNDNNDPDIIKIMACCKTKLVVLSINLNPYSFKHYTISKEMDINYSSFYKIDNNYVVIGDKGGFKLFGKKKEEVEKIFDKNYLGGIQIENNIYALTSNKLFPNGENKLIIYDFSTNQTLKEIKNYKFDFTSNALCLIDLNKTKSLGVNVNEKLLLCSCAKDKRRGILIVRINLVENKFTEKFYETKDFEPSCFCHISNVSNDNSITGDITNENYIEVDETEYLIVGGFDPDKRMGCTKLYKLKYNKEKNNINIQYLIDIGVEDKENNFKGFDMKITCITQSKITGNLLINSLDGNVYLFKPPNLECFLRN